MTRRWLKALAAAALVPAAPLAAGTDGAADETLYARCIGCHSPERNRTGPRHCGLFGRVSGTVQDYEYSRPMRAAGIVWDAQTLDRFLEAPLEVVPGTTMGFAGIADAGERRRLIAWLATLDGDSPLCPGGESPERSQDET